MKSRVVPSARLVEGLNKDNLAKGDIVYVKDGKHKGNLGIVEKCCPQKAKLRFEKKECHSNQEEVTHLLYKQLSKVAVTAATSKSEKYKSRDTPGTNKDDLVKGDIVYIEEGKYKGIFGIVEKCCPQKAKLRLEKQECHSNEQEVTHLLYKQLSKVAVTAESSKSEKYTSHAPTTDSFSDENTVEGFPDDMSADDSSLLAVLNKTPFLKTLLIAIGEYLREQGVNLKSSEACDELFMIFDKEV